ncbi:MAG: DUF1822 family protein [Leptolyngbyaceae cyanobacterium]
MNNSQPAAEAARLIWPITQQGKMIAQQFASRHEHPATAERVRQNTLAVWVVYEFLDTLGIAADLSTSDSWNPAIQLTEDVADLVISGMGRLECRPVSVTTEPCPMPLEVLTERIGYVAVALDETAGEASLLGFTAALPSAQLILEQLQPMDDFPTHLWQMQHAVEREMPLTRLSQWLGGQFESGWQTVDDLLAQHFLTPAFRQGRMSAAPVPIKRAKQLDLGLKLGTAQVALVLEVEPESEAVVTIGVRLYPLGGPVYLPEGLAIAILDESDTVCLTAQSRHADNYLQLYFRGHAGEPFTTQVTLETARIMEHFVI